ncbi:MAG: PEGA domain-containing protein [Deltaproteobacteria bacterium]|nr:PEGA domain-containing protein [Deltaproteobacteria bacterium]
MKRTTLVLSSILFLATSSFAKDEPPPRLKLVCFALPADKASERAAALFNQRLRDAFSSASGHELIDTKAFLYRGDRDPRMNDQHQARSMAQEGQEALDVMEMEDGIAKLLKAKEKYQKSVGRFGDGKEYVNLMLQIGAAQILAGKVDDAAMIFQEAAMFDPEVQMDPAKYTPAMLDVLERGRVFAASQPLCAGQVKSVPDAAEVYRNGVFVGVSPLAFRNVPEGTQYLRVEKDGYLPWGEQVEFQAMGEEYYQAKLDKASRLKAFQALLKDKILEDMNESPPPFPIVRLGEFFEAKRLVLLKVKQEGLEIKVDFLFIELDPRRKLHFHSGDTFRLNPDHNLILNSELFQKQVDKYFKDQAKQLFH